LMFISMILIMLLMMIM